MSPITRTPLRNCGGGPRYRTEDEALRSKRTRHPDFREAEECPRCEGWHAVIGKSVPAAVKTAPRETGPSRKMRALICARDGYQCVRCGKPAGPDAGPYSIQHRIARQSGGTSDPEANSPSRLLLLCGSATTGCHGEVEARKDPHDLAAGYRLESWQDPEAEGVMYFDASGCGVTKWLEAGGGLADEAPGRAA